MRQPKLIVVGLVLALSTTPEPVSAASILVVLGGDGGGQGCLNANLPSIDFLDSCGDDAVTADALEVNLGDALLRSTDQMVILDQDSFGGDGSITLAPDQDLILETRNGVGDANGGINFADSTDSIVTQGDGAITLIAGSGGAFTADLSNIGNLHSEAGAIALTASDDIDIFGSITSASGAVNLTAGGSITISSGSFIDAGSGNLTLQVDSSGGNAETLAVLGSVTATGTVLLLGNGSDDTLQSGDGNNTWAVYGANAGMLNGASYSAFAMLSGGNGDDSFTVNAGGSVTSISGGTGNDTIIGDAATANTFVINAADAGTANGIAFFGVENLTGGSAGDTFTFSAALSGTASGDAGDDTFAINDGGSVGAIDGGAGNDEVTYTGSTGPVTVLTDAFTNVETLTGSASAGDTLLGTAAGDVFTVDGANAGTAGGINYSGFENLDGLSGADTYVFGSGGFLAGSIGFDDLDALLLFDIFSVDLGLSAGDDLFDLGFLSFDSSSLFFRSSVLDDFGLLVGLSGFDGTLASDSFDPYRVTAAAASVPEPGTLALFGVGLACMGLARRRRHI